MWSFIIAFRVSTLCISGEDSSNLIIQMQYGFLITQPGVLFVQDYGDVILIVLLVFHYAVGGCDCLRRIRETSY